MDITTASFSGHESFSLRNTWLTKGVVGCSIDPTLFTRDEAMVLLGVGKNMVRSIRHWCLATQVIEEDPEVRNNRGRQMRPTQVGARLFLGANPWDRYLEDAGTLWLIHWLLATNATRATTWHFAFSEFHQPTFTRTGLERAVTDRTRRLPSARATEGTLKRDVDVFIRTYVANSRSSKDAFEDAIECPLAELDLIYEQATSGTYMFVRGPKPTLPDPVFLFALWEYARGLSSRSTVTFDELAYEPNGVGRVFKLDEGSLGERLDRLADLTEGAWQFSETAGFKQVLFLQDVDPYSLLNRYYFAQRGEEKTL